MATLLWGKVFYQDKYVGIISEEPGGGVLFEYDDTYSNSAHPSISYSLPKNIKSHISNSGLHPFFDNLVSEGWLERAQTRLLGKRQASRFSLLLAFGYDCAGAVSVVDPNPEAISNKLLDPNDSKELAAFTSRASLSGVQPKLAVVLRDGKYYPAKLGEISTHIAKFPSSSHLDIVSNEYLTTRAYKAFLPDDTVVEVSIEEVAGINETALLIKRFDRLDGQKLHFEEFNQLLGKSSDNKYQGSYQEMSDFIFNNPEPCLPIESYRLFQRIVVGFLLGNTDMHLKNFAMLHTAAGMRLAPTYDQVAATLYDYKTLALSVCGIKEFPLGSLKSKHIIRLAKDFKISNENLELFTTQLQKQKEAAKDAVAEATSKADKLKAKLIKLIDTRWNAIFALIGKSLSKKQ